MKPPAVQAVSDTRVNINDHLMKYFLPALLVVSLFMPGCRSTRELKKIIAPVDSAAIIRNRSIADSLRFVDSTMSAFRNHHIDFHSFSGKLKVEAEGSKGKQPDLTAVIKIISDSAIWLSISSSFLNIEVYRVLITHDSLILLNKQDKVIQFRSLDYLQEVTGIPFDYKTMEDLLVGNPVFFSDSIYAYTRKEDVTLISARAYPFKNLLTLSNDKFLLLHSKLDDLEVDRHRTADISYSDFDNQQGYFFPAGRQIVITEKNMLDVRMNYKQYEFNKELSIQFSIPRNYKRD